MAKGNPDGNPDIVEHGKSTQFGQPGGADPREARAAVVNNPSCVRQKLKRLAVYVPGKEQATPNDLAKAFGKDKKLTNLSMAEIWAVRRAQQAMGNYKAMDTMIDSISGKLVTKQVELQVDSYAELVMAADKIARAEAEADDEPRE